MGLHESIYAGKQYDEDERVALQWQEDDMRFGDCPEGYHIGWVNGKWDYVLNTPEYIAWCKAMPSRAEWEEGGVRHLTIKDWGEA